MAQEKEKTLQRVTLKEMYDIFASDIYKDFRVKHGIELKTEILRDGLKHLSMKINKDWSDGEIEYMYNNAPLLFRHIVAEQLFIDLLDSGNFDYKIKNDKYKNYFVRPLLLMKNFIYLLERWTHPLVWVDPLDEKSIVSERRVAKEQFDKKRVESNVLKKTVYYLLIALRIQFAIEPPMVNYGRGRDGIPSGLHIWETLTCKYAILDDIFEDSPIRYEDVKCYDALSLSDNLGAIAELLGGKTAAELLRMLQKEWPKIKVWGMGLSNMTRDEIEVFENQLMNGFGDLLEEWDAMALKSEEAKKKKRQKRRGRTAEALFLGKDKKKDEKRTEEEAKRLIEYLKKHKMSSLELDSSKSNVLQKIIVSFYMQWALKKMASPCESANVAALYRFLTEDCQLKTSTEPKGVINNLRDMIKAGKIDKNHHGEISELFSRVSIDSDSAN